MLLKVFVSLEGAFKKLDRDFDIMVAIQPTFTRRSSTSYLRKPWGNAG